MRIFAAFLILFLLSPLLFFSQNADKHCGTQTFHEFLKKSDPTYEARREQMKYLPSVVHADKSSGDKIIPVVVHVIYRLDEQNISDEQIQTQINVLNSDFNSQNWDTLKVPSPFKPLIGNAQLKFRLANRDEQGNKTNGITRKKTTLQDIANSSGDVHCTSSKGGVDPWDRDKYLNIWVCEISGGLYGFSSYPGSPAGCDGIVVNFNCFGTIGTATVPTEKGRTATHEIGHWLNLIHIWGDALCGTDLVDDTPPQDSANYGCRNFPHVSCNNGPDGDMFMNYMDYSDDACMHLFTQGQVDRMLTALDNFRPDIINSDGYNSISELHSRLSYFGPNPAKNEVLIQSEGIINKVLIYSFDGILVTEKDVNRQSLKLSTVSLSNGMYMMLIAHMNGESESHKFIIQH